MLGLNSKKALNSVPFCCFSAKSIQYQRASKYKGVIERSFFL